MMNNPLTESQVQDILGCMPHLETLTISSGITTKTPEALLENRSGGRCVVVIK